MAHQIALVAVPTLDIMAAGTPFFEGHLLAVLQAGRGRICAQRYHWQDRAWTPVGDPVITAWQPQIEALAHQTLVAGEIDDDGAALLQTTDRPLQIAPGAHALRRAGFLAELAWRRIHQNAVDDPARVTPIYLHQPGVSRP